MSTNRNTYRPPADVAAEKHALSAAMRAGRTLQFAFAEAVRAEMFTGARQEAAAEVLRLIGEATRPDVETVCAGLQGRAAEAARDARSIQVTPSNLPAFASSVRAAHLLRQQVLAGEALVAGALDADPGSVEDAEAAQEEAQRAVMDLSAEVLGGAGAVRAGAMAPGLIGEIMASGKKDLTGVTTGLRDFDRLTGGLQPGTLVVVAARPAQGKSALMGNMALRAALGEAGVKAGGSYQTEPTPAAIFSLEMPARRLAKRLLAARAHVNQRRARPDDEKALRAASAQMEAAPLFIDDQSGLRVAEIAARLRRLKAEHDIGAAYVDFLQRVGTPRGMGGFSKNDTVGHNARRLADLARELEIPIVLLCQLNRGVEHQGGPPRPSLAHLRDSGEIEDSADIVAFLCRLSEYGITEYPEDGSPTEGTAELLVKKHREGELSSIRLAYKKEHTRFDDLAGRDDPGENRSRQAEGGQGHGYRMPGGYEKGESDASGDSAGAPVPDDENFPF